MRLIHEDLTYQLRGFCYQTYNSLGPGFNEKLYQEICFKKCLDAGIEAKKEHDINVIYKGHEIATLSLDLLVDGKVIVEFKAVDSIKSVHKAQIICYLRAADIPIGLLVNFSLRGVQIERLANFPQTVEKVQTENYFSLTDAYDDLLFNIVNAICEVWNELGYGYLESVYLRALEFELGVSKFAFDLENQLDVFFEGKRIGKQKINSILNDEIWLCLTSTTKQCKGLEKKVRSILKSTPLSCAVLANLNGNRPKIKIIRK